MRVLVCGGRSYCDIERLRAVLDAHPITELCHGDARGADRLAGQWATARRVPVKAYPADWERYGKSAGSIRNAFMLHDFRPDYVIAFPGQAGTADMCRKAAAARLIVIPAGT